MIAFCQNILFEGKLPAQYDPPHSEYAELMCLKRGNDTDHTVAQHVAEIIMKQPEFEGTNNERILAMIAHQHATTILVNAFDEEKDITKGGTLHTFTMFDFMSRVNHSCSPNVYHIINDMDITDAIAVLNAFKKGEQILISYLGDNYIDDDLDRSRYILEHWNFNRRCGNCNSKDILDVQDALFRSIESAYNQDDSLDVEVLQKKCSKYLTKYGHNYSKSVDYVSSIFAEL